MQLAGIPVGVAINSGIGLLNPFGGQEGYEAAIPDPDDRNKTSNVLAEIGSKYILGRSGNLLPWMSSRNNVLMSAKTSITIQSI